VPGTAAGRAAAELPWLCPSTDSLIALAEAPAGLPAAAAADPALAAFLLRFAHPSAEPDPFGFAPGAVHSPHLPDTAAAHLAAVPGAVLPHQSFAFSQVRVVADRAAAVAARLAACRRVPAHAAATAALLAPLGWYAVAAVDPFAAAEPTGDPTFAAQPAAVQAEVWGLDHAAITRRLAARWRLPDWVATTIGCLTLPFRTAGHLVSHPDLFAVVQLAVLEAERAGPGLGLTGGADRAALLAHLRLGDGDVADAARGAEPAPPPGGSGLPPDPHRVPLVSSLLKLAGESRRRNGPGLVARLEARIDLLHRAAADLGAQAAGARDARLAGLAELAAGAGHEINNPLAVISANAQRLIRTEPDPDRGEALRGIVRQTDRIAGLLRDLMHFARPPRPDARSFPAADLLNAAWEEVAPQAADRRVRPEVVGAAAGVWLHGDPRQLRHALVAVLRNAVEAAGDGGWVRVTAAAPDADRVVIAVEDSGPGLPADVAAHAFDPFYSGRSAGRGRGLGLPTAWRLVRQNGGDLRHDPTPAGPTRFVLTAPRGTEAPVRRSA
jgi:signal transduction histidine kinase